MPTYEYECQSCGHKFDLFQKITSEPQKECPSCGKPAAKRLISAGAGVIFKGSGFYATDYRKSGGKKSPAPRCGASGGKPECSSCPGSNPKND